MNDVIGISPAKGKAISQSLNQLLAEYQVYYQNLRIFHWRVTGPQFFTLHEFFEQLYQEARNNIDEIAERVLTLGEAPVDKWSHYLDMAKIPEASGDISAAEMVRELLDNHKVVIRNLRNTIEKSEDAHDAGTADMATAMMKSLEKSSWMLQSWTKGAMVPDMV